MSVPRDTAARMAERAQAFVDSLSAEQRALACWPFPSDEERRRWYYTPTDHGGLTLGARIAKFLADTLAKPGDLVGALS